MSDDKKKQVRRREIEDLSLVMAQEWGRRLVRRILDRAGVLRSVVRDLPIDQDRAIWYASGQQDFGHWLLDEVSTASFDGVKKMNDEAHAAKLDEAERARQMTKEADNA